MPNFVPVTPRDIGTRRWRRAPNLRHAQQREAVALGVDELPKAVLHLPVALVRQKQGWLPAAVLALHKAQNAFVSPGGDWLAGHLPAAFTVYPFALAQSAGEGLQLCFDADSGLFTQGAEGEAFFDDAGRPTRVVREQYELLLRLESGRKRAAAACAALDRHGLIRPWSITVRTDVGEAPVVGLHRVDEAALNKLPAEALLELRNAGALVLAYSQLLSMQHLQTLGRLANAQGQAKHDAATRTIVKDGELDMEFLNQGGTLSLRGL